MTSPTTYRNRVVEYLESGYGVQDATVTNTEGGHRRLRFTYHGVPHTLTLHDSPGKLSGNALSMKLQDIRRELGEPLPKPAVLPKRKLEDMMPQAALGGAATSPTLGKPDEPPVTYTGSVSLARRSGNADGLRLRVAIPRALFTLFGHSAALRVTAGPDDTFDVYPRPGVYSTPHFRQEGDRYIVVFEKHGIPSDAPLYGASRAEVVLVDGHLLFKLLERKPPLRGSSADAPVVQRSERAAHNGDVAGSNPAGRTTTEGPSMPTTDEIRGALAVLRAAEMHSLLRLTRVEGRLVMQARIE